MLQAARAAWTTFIVLALAVARKRSSKSSMPTPMEF